MTPKLTSNRLTEQNCVFARDDHPKYSENLQDLQGHDQRCLLKLYNARSSKVEKSKYDRRGSLYLQTMDALYVKKEFRFIMYRRLIRFLSFSSKYLAI